MKKAFSLLSGIIVLAGCGGFQHTVTQNFLYPAPAQLMQDFSPFLADRGVPPSASPGIYPLPEIQPEELLPSAAEPENTFCLRDESLFGMEGDGDDQGPGTALALLRMKGEPPFGEMRTPVPGDTAIPEEREREINSLFGSVEGDPQKSHPASAKPLPRENAPLSGGNGSEEPFARVQEILSLYQTELPSPPPSIPETGGQPAADGEKNPAQILARFPTLLNDQVKKFIDLFQTKADGFFTRSLARSQAYEGMMKKILREKNLPEELFYLALIESGYNPNAQSRAKATGIWQFMNLTGKRYGLRVDKWVDERRDPEKSTHAAAEYLKNLYEMFNCWYLAAAGYNAGEGKVIQAMKRAKSQDFWEISKHRYLKRETKEYVPMLLAAMVIAQDPPKYGFSNIDYHPPLLYEKVAVPPGIRLDKIARASETSLEEIQRLNPALRQDKTPPEGPSFEIKLPPGKKEVFGNNFSRVFKLDPRTARRHEVRRGETLGQIAKKYRVDLQEICEGNEITPKTLIKPGMVLLLPP